VFDLDQYKMERKPKMTVPKVLLILFDGAEWNVIQPPLDAGRLPHLAAFMRQGSYGRLRSLQGVALASPILWTSLASGKLPHKHGVKDFYDTAASVQCIRLWEIFEHEQLPIGLFRYLITWPPRPTNGFIVPDWCGRTPDAFPPELSFINTMNQGMDWHSLVRNGALALRYGMRLSTLRLGVKEALQERLFSAARLDKYYRQRLLELEIHTDLFLGLLRRFQPYFAAFYTGLPDAVHHQYWKFLEPEKFPEVSPAEIRRYGGVIPQVYEALDRQLGRLLRQAGPETLVVIASDHGGQANTWEEYRWADIRIEAFINVLGLTGAMSGFRLGRKTYFRLRKASEAAGSIHQMAESVSQVALVGSSVPIFKAEVSGEDEMAVEVVYLKLPTPDVELIFPDGRRFPIDQLLNLTATISGAHSPHGILLLRGPHVRHACEISGASLLDVTPTILALLGRPIGQDMDGRVLTEAIDPEFLRHQPVQFIDSYDQLLDKAATPAVEDPEVGMEVVKSRLRDLGYLD
jgi:hypothetical protein